MTGQRSDVELRHLASFTELAQTLHFGRAAANLYISQSALSHQIASLERAVGAPLFVRTTRHVQLTAAGEHLAAGLPPLVRGIDGLLADVRAVGEGRRGRLRIAASGSLTSGLLPVALRRFRAQFADVDVTVRGDVITPDQIVALRRGEIDLGLLRPPVPDDDDDLAVESIGEEAMICAVPVGHRLSDAGVLGPGDLVDEPLVLYRPGSSLRLVTDAYFAGVGHRATAAYEVSETYTVVSMVAAGLGVALVPASLASLRLEGVAYRPLEAPARLGIAIVTRRDDQSILVANFTDAVRRSLVPELTY